MGYQSYKILGIINARGGSKGILKKNIKPLNGKPLIGYSIEAGLKSRYLDDLIVSTDDKEIAEIAVSFGANVPFIRPDELAKDNVRQIWSIFHALDLFKDKMEKLFDILVLLQPTSPFRKACDIDECIRLLVKTGSDSVISFSPVMGGHPYHMFTLEEQIPKKFIDLKTNNLQRQNFPKAYIVNGAVKVAKVDWLYKNKTFISDNMQAYIMPIERSVNIDSEFDWVLAEFLITQSSHKH